MAVAGLELAGNAVLQGVLTGISLGLELTPVVGPFLQPIFVGIWDSALAGQTVAQKVVAMNALFESVQTITNEAIAQNVADQVRACNASIAQLGQDYCDSVKAFKNGATSSDKVVVLFKNCKSTLEQMLDLCAQPSHMKHTVLSYGSALALYVGLLRDMMLAGADCGYSKSEIIEINNTINNCIKSAYSQTLCEAVTKLVIESGESAYPKVGSLVLNLGNLVGGLMTFNNEWHDGKACRIAKTHPNYDNCDFVDNTAHYQLTYRPKAVSTNTYNMPQVFMNGRPALHCFTDLDKKLDLAAFIVDEKLNVKLRAYYLVDNNDLNSSNVEVTISCEDNPKVHQVYLNKQQKAVVSCPWVKMYHSSSEGGPVTSQYDKFSTAMTMRYDEYAGFQAEKGKAYTISTRAGSSSTKNYYIIGFEIVPTSGPPDLLESVVTAIELTAGAVVSGVTNVVTGSLGAIGKIFHL